MMTEQSLQKSGESESSVNVFGKCEIHIVNELLICRWRWKKQYRCFEIIAHMIYAKSMNNNFVFSRRDRDFYNLVYRDKIEICIL